MTSGSSDAQELAQLKAQIARNEAIERARYTGVKPLVIWYGFWAALFGFGGVMALFQGQFVTFLIGAVIAVLAGVYTRYLYNGGRRRVWFFIF